MIADIFGQPSRPKAFVNLWIVKVGAQGHDRPDITKAKAEPPDREVANGKYGMVAWARHPVRNNGLDRIVFQAAVVTGRIGHNRANGSRFVLLWRRR
jgi:hypothetical protein